MKDDRTHRSSATVLDPGRVGRLLSLDWHVHRKSLFILLGVLLAVFLFASVVGSSEGDLSDEGSFFDIWHGILLLGGGYLFTSFSIPETSSPEGRLALLTLPVSTTERFVEKWLLTGPLYALFITLLTYLLAPVINLLLDALGLSPYHPLDWTGGSLFQLLGVYLLLVNPVALLGAFWFNGSAFAKTGFTALAVSFAYGAIMALIGFLIFSNQEGGQIDGDENLLVEFVEDHHWVALALVAVFFLTVAWFKAREKEA